MICDMNNLIHVKRTKSVVPANFFHVPKLRLETADIRMCLASNVLSLECYSRILRATGKITEYNQFS